MPAVSQRAEDDGEGHELPQRGAEGVADEGRVARIHAP
jgi:hypothetical protein